MFFTREGLPLDLVDSYPSASAFLIAGGPSFAAIDKTRLRSAWAMTLNNATASFRGNASCTVDDPSRFSYSLDPTIQKFAPFGVFDKPLWDNRLLENGIGAEQQWCDADLRVRDCPNLVGFRRNEKFDATQFLYEDSINWGCNARYGGGRSVMLAALRILFLRFCRLRWSSTADKYFLMQPRLRFLATVAVSFAGAFLCSALAAPLAAQTLGVTAALTTSGYQFNVSPIAPATAATGVSPSSFHAVYRLVNHSDAAISFQIPEPKVGLGVMAIMLPKVIFSVYDNTGALVWASSANPSNLVNVDVPLSAGSSWHLGTEVPLVINGQPLDGDYTLVAKINGSPEFSATTSFTVTNQAVANDVQGTVLEGPLTPVDKVGQPNEGPCAGAIVQYRNAAIEGGPGLGGFQQVIADQNGHFAFNVPTGKYTIIATIPGDQGKGFGSGTQTVSVVQGSVSNVTFHLDTGIR